jgi:hypothetical protein
MGVKARQTIPTFLVGINKIQNYQAFQPTEGRKYAKLGENGKNKV